MDIKTFVEKWEPSGAAEHSNSQSFLNDLCDVLGVQRPKPATGDPAKDTYVFEKPVLLANEENASVGHVDLFKDGHFILEAKQGSNLGTKRIGTARRGTPAWNIAMRDAYGQALGYAQTLDDPPPFVVTTDIGYCFEFYAAFDGSGNYRAFPNAQTNRVYLKALLDPTAGPKHLAVLRAVFTDPHSLDPSKLATKVTREVAEHLAELARVLEEAGEPPERVARFLMRCIFTMFAEDVGLLPDGLFADLIENHWLPSPPAFPGGIRSLWKAMNEGGDYFVGKLLQFNGGLFKDTDAPPLKAEHLLRLQEAARCDWSEVEPAIFGTLLERALDPHERHRLGAHYTPRAYVERLVRPTIEEPLRAEWDLVRAEVRQLVEAGKEAAAKKAVRAFYDKLTHTRVLDPACGTGNFLYVTLDLFKRLEAEVVALLSELEESQTIGEVAGYGVTPQQFLGIEVKPWAKEIAELVLWIGYLQWHFRTRGRVNPPEPVLRDYGNIELRDAVLAYDREELVRDANGVPVSRWDGRTFKVSPLTGEDVPDESARVPEYQYVNARKATWPKADFIIGNPPFLGTKRMRAVLGTGYVDALRATYSEHIEDNADFVMFWWHKAATALEGGEIRRFGLITTNSISQAFNRRVLARHLESGTRIVWAIPDHPWTDDISGAAVRIAMTVGSRDPGPAMLCEVVEEEARDDADSPANLTFRVAVAPAIRADLHIGADVGLARGLRANEGLAGFGMALHGQGFVLEPDMAAAFRRSGGRCIRPFVGGRDLSQTPRERYVIDFSGLSKEEARAANARAFQHVADHVRPEREHNRRDSIRELWWRFGWERPELRKALAGTRRYIATPETAKHRIFQFVPTKVVPDHKVVVVALEDAFFLGVLSSRAHEVWALRTGGRLGVGNDPVYNKTRCFDPFPFPDCSDSIRERIRAAGEALDAHRHTQQREHPTLTFTGMYNVLVKLRGGSPLSEQEKAVHERGLVSVLREMHDELDAAMLAAYGWPNGLTDEQILERLVALNLARAAEEAQGLVRWLRPPFQQPEGVAQQMSQAVLLGTPTATSGAAPVAVSWPKKLLERVAAVRNFLAQDGAASRTTEEVARAFVRAKRTEVEEVLQGLSALGLAVSFTVGDERRWRSAGRRAA